MIPVSIATSGHAVTSISSHSDENESEMNGTRAIHSFGNQPFNISVINIPGPAPDLKGNGQAPT